jgi:hypothetical protein
MSVIEFVNDVNIFTYGLLTERNYKILKKPYRRCLHWAVTYEANFALEKYKIIHLIRARKKFNLKAVLIFDEIRLIAKDYIRILKV